MVDQIKKRKIAYLDVDNNKISGKILTSLLSILPVRKLHLVRNQLTDEQVEPIYKNLVETQNLKLLYMSHNRMSDKALGMLAEGLSANSGI